MISRAIILRSAALPPVERMVRRSPIFKPIVNRFIAGDSLAPALVASTELLAKGLRVTLDYLGENTRSESEALQARETYEKMLGEIKQVPEFGLYAKWKDSPNLTAPPVPDPLNISIKLTQCGLDQGEDFAEENYRAVLRTALNAGNFVRVDMEGSAYTERTINIVTRTLKDFPNTGTVLQSYLYRNDDDVERMISLRARVRLVKGAYLEPASVAYPDKEKVDEAYVRQAKRLLKDGYYPALATQDEKIIDHLKAFATGNGIRKDGFEFQMLYGIRRDLQDKLRKEGYNVRIYVPFGDSWYPYFTRRLAERPANALFILKALAKG